MMTVSVQTLGLTTAASMIISGRVGSANITSVITVPTASTGRKYAETSPIAVPSTSAINEAATPIIRLVRVPQTTWAKMSCPRSSVPNQCRPDGDWSTSALVPPGSSAISGAATASTTITTRTATATRAEGWRR